MRLVSKFAFTVLFGALIAGPACAAGPNSVTNSVANNTDALLKSGPIAGSIPLPDATHIPMIFGKDIKWRGENGEHQAPIFGDPTKPGIYGVLIQWDPGHNSKPHFHSTDRYIYVVSGTWWVSASTHYDESKMYPIPAGSFVTDIKNTVHWDGAKAQTGPCLLMLVGEGPMVTSHFQPKSPNSADYVPVKQ